MKPVPAVRRELLDQHPCRVAPDVRHEESMRFGPDLPMYRIGPPRIFRD